MAQGKEESNALIVSNPSGDRSNEAKGCFIDGSTILSIQVSKAMVIVNPHSGSKKGIRALSALQKAIGTDIELVVANTTHAGHAREMMQNDDLSTFQLICPIGGDGTLHETIDGLLLRNDDAKSKITIGIIPAGSGNTVAFDMGIYTVDSAISKIKRGLSRRCDVHVITDKSGGERNIHSINCVGYGLPADVMANVNAMRSCCGGAYYNLAVYRAFFSFTKYHLRVSWVDESGESHVHPKNDFVMIQGQNSRSIGDKMPFCPDAKFDDGLIDLVLVEYGSRLQLLRVFENAKKGKHIGLKGVTYVKCREFTVEELLQNGEVSSVRRADALNIDGELGGYSRTTIRCEKHAISLIV